MSYFEDNTKLRQEVSTCWALVESSEKELKTLRPRVKELEGVVSSILPDRAGWGTVGPAAMAEAKRILAKQPELATLKQAQETGVVWEDCCFEGSPPEPFENWIDWACSRVKRNVTIRASCRDDFEKAQDGPDFEDGCSRDGFVGGCERMGCQQAQEPAYYEITTHDGIKWVGARPSILEKHTSKPLYFAAPQPGETP